MVSGPQKPRKELPVIQPGQSTNQPPDDFETLLEWIGAGVEQMEHIEDDRTREDIFALLQGVDTMHRHALSRLVDQVSRLGGQRLMDRVAQDPVVHTLLDMYDLTETNEHSQVERALQNVHPYIGSHGGQLDVLGVEDGRVTVRLSGACQGCPGSSVTLKRVVEQALTEHVPGFQELIVEEPPPPPAEPERRPRWVSAGWIDDYAPRQIHSQVIEGTSLLLFRVGAELYAYRDGCPPGSPLTLTTGRLEGNALICPWHGCRYDITSGSRLDSGTVTLQPIPVAVQNWQVQVAIEIEEVATG